MYPLRKALIGGILICSIWIGTGLFLFISHHRTDVTLLNAVPHTTLISLAIASTLLTVFLLRIWGSKVLFAYVLFFSLILVFQFPCFSPIDEESHFVYTTIIRTQHRLPLVSDPVPDVAGAMTDNKRNPENKPIVPEHLGSVAYETFHPPVYYIASAILTGIIPGGLSDLFYFQRLLGTVSLCLICCMLIRFGQQLPDFNLKSHWGLSTAIVMFLLHPGLLQRMSTVSNVHLALILHFVLYLWLAKVVIHQKIPGTRTVAWMGLLSGLAMTTNILNFTVTVVILLYLLRGHSFKKLLAFASTASIPVLIWFGWNKQHYGSITGWNGVHEKIQKVSGTLDHPYQLTDYLTQIPDRLIRFFWTPEEMRVEYFPSRTMEFVLTLILITTLLFAVRSSVRSKNHPSSPQEEWVIWCLMGIIINLSFLVWMTWSQNLPMLLGRHLYYSLFPLFYLVLYTLNRISNIVRDMITGIVLFAVSTLWWNFMLLLIIYNLR